MKAVNLAESAGIYSEIVDSFGLEALQVSVYACLCVCVLLLSAYISVYDLVMDRTGHVCGGKPVYLHLTASRTSLELPMLI